MDLTERYTEETHETPFDHMGGYSYDFTKWVMKVAEDALEEATALEEDAAGEAL
jgi:hypothetical protein